MSRFSSEGEFGSVFDKSSFTELNAFLNSCCRQSTDSKLVIVFCEVAQSHWQRSYLTCARRSAVEESAVRLQAEQTPGITQHNVADHVQTVMQVTNDVTESVAFPISTVAKLMSSLCKRLKILVVQCMVHDDINIWSVIRNNEWHLSIFNIL